MHWTRGLGLLFRPIGGQLRLAGPPLPAPAEAAGGTATQTGSPLPPLPPRDQQTVLWRERVGVRDRQRQRQRAKREAKGRRVLKRQRRKGWGESGEERREGVES